MRAFDKSLAKWPVSGYSGGLGEAATVPFLAEANYSRVLPKAV